LVALIDVTSEQARRALVSADIVVGGQRSNTHVVLEGSDRLIAHCEDEHHEMTSVGNGSYDARMGCDAGDFVIALVRDGAPPAPRSLGRLPSVFEITSDFPDTPISRAHDTLTLTWSPSGSDAEVTIEIEGDCIRSEELQVPHDSGKYVIEPGKLTAWKSQEQEACNAALRVVRTKKGLPDPALDRDSSVVLRQIRATRFVSGP
jgi:hypothetical protein